VLGLLTLGRVIGSTRSVNGLPPYDDLPETVQVAFRGRTMLSMPELAAALEMHVQTLRAHVSSGNITGRFKGVGKIKRRMVFTISDVAKYFRAPHNAEYFRPPVRRIEKLATPSNLVVMRPCSPTVNITLRKRRPKKP
jgi:hypothetical protein